MSPPQQKPSFPGQLVRSGRVFVVVLAAALAGCQSTGHIEDADETTIAVGLQKETEWLNNVATTRQPEDIWERMRGGFALQNEIGVNPRVERQRLWFVSRPAHINKVSERGALYIHYIVERLEEKGMPLELALLPVIESAYDPMAYSRAQAVGLWQFIPSTGRDYNLRQTHWYDGRRDITASTRAAIEYLSRLHEMFNGDWLLALAAYNAGEGTVSRAMERNSRLGLPTDYWNLNLPQETQDYVPKLLALSQLIMTPEAYGIELSPIANEPYFEKVELNRSVDLSRLAEMADMDKDELIQLNPAYKRGITMDGPRHLLVPASKAELLQANLALMKPQDLVEWKQHQVRPGESLHGIANLYQMTARTLKDINNLPSNRLRVGQVLSIPAQPGVKPIPLYQNLASQEPATAKPAATPVAKPRTYRVRKGDSLWDIAKANKVDVGDLQRWNKLRSKNLKAGQVLALQGPSRPAAGGSKKRETVTYYKVRKGDSLALIAKRFQVDLKTLQRWNSIDSRLVRPGQTLTLYLPN